jgi:hypothetical protein
MQDVRGLAVAVYAEHCCPVTLVKMVTTLLLFVFDIFKAQLLQYIQGERMPQADA